MTPVRKPYITSTIHVPICKLLGFPIQIQGPRSSDEAEQSERMPRWPTEEARDE